MTDTNTAPADATALPDGIANAGIASTGEPSLEDRKNAALAKLDQVKAELDAAYQRATQESGWVHAVETFIEDINVKADGIVAWIKRHI